MAGSPGPGGELSTDIGKTNRGGGNIVGRVKGSSSDLGVRKGKRGAKNKTTYRISGRLKQLTRAGKGGRGSDGSLSLIQPNDDPTEKGGAGNIPILILVRRHRKRGERL